MQSFPIYKVFQHKDIHKTTCLSPDHSLLQKPPQLMTQNPTPPGDKPVEQRKLYKKMQ